MHSQNGEDGVLEAIFSEVGLHASSGSPSRSLYDVSSDAGGTYVEFGVEDGVECNTRVLREEFGWSGLLMDGGHSNAAMGLQQEWISRENINGLLSKHGVGASFDLLVIDIDFNDFYVWQALLREAKHRARVVVVEINSNLGPDVSRTVTFVAEHTCNVCVLCPCSPTVCRGRYNASHQWSGGRYYGMSVKAAWKLGRAHGYALVYCESHGVNCIFVREDVLLESAMRHAGFAQSVGDLAGSPRDKLMAFPSTRSVLEALAPEVVYRPPNYFGTNEGLKALASGAIDVPHAWVDV